LATTWAVPSISDNGGNFFACHDNGDVDLLVGANSIDALLKRMVEDALVKEDQGIHRLVLGGGRDVCVDGEVSQERFDLGFGGEKVLTGPHSVETDKPHDPIYVGSLGVNGVVVQTEYLSDLIEEFWLLTFCRVRHIKPRNDSPISLIIGVGQNCPKTRLLSHYQGKLAS
jgi:hypothetical protein